MPISPTVTASQINAAIARAIASGRRCYVAILVHLHAGYQLPAMRPEWCQACAVIPGNRVQVVPIVPTRDASGRWLRGTCEVSVSQCTAVAVR